MVNESVIWVIIGLLAQAIFVPDNPNNVFIELI